MFLVINGGKNANTVSKDNLKWFEFLNITSKNYKIINYDEILFLSFAEGGAQGTPGEVNIITGKSSKIKAYSTNYLLGKIKFDEIIELFPPLKENVFRHVLKGWKYINLGSGNHLLIRDELYDEFFVEVGKLAVRKNRAINEVIGRGIIFQNWQGMAINVLQERDGVAQSVEKS